MCVTFFSNDTVVNPYLQTTDAIPAMIAKTSLLRNLDKYYRDQLLWTIIDTGDLRSLYDDKNSVLTTQYYNGTQWCDISNT